MKYEYKMVSMPRNLATKSGEDLGGALASYVENTVNKMANEGWEFYRADAYSIAEMPGCLASLFGHQENIEHYNVLAFRKEI